MGKQTLGKWILDLLYPPKCPFCGRILEREEEGLCARCQPILPWTEGQNEAVEFCDLCLSPLHYRDGVRDAVHRYKFNGGQSHSRIFGTLMAQCLNDRWDGKADAIVWVPLSQKGLRKRGYDQAELLARRVGEVCGVPVIRGLEKVRHTAVQSRQSGDSARRANVLGAYRTVEGQDLSGLRIVLVDDVVTSGATLSECAACLRMAEAAEVVGLTLAAAGR